MLLSVVTACERSHEREISNPEIYDQLHGEWDITEIHLSDDIGEIPTMLLNTEFGYEIATLTFYRPTLGDPARLSVFWYCNGFRFNFEYSDGELTRLSQMVGPMNNPWLAISKRILVEYLEGRLNCGTSPNAEDQELETIAVFMSGLANQFVQYHRYEIELLDSETVSVFTQQGDGVYATRR